MHNNYQIKPPLIQSNTLDAVTVWVEALHGHGSLLSAIKMLSDLVGAQAGLLARQPGDNSKIQQIAYHDAKAEKILTRKCRPFALDVLNKQIEVLPLGSIVTLQAAAREGMIGREALTGFHAVADIHGVYDIAVVPLQSGYGAREFIEFQFSSEIGEHNINLLIMLAGSLAKAWSSRITGTSAKEIAKSRSRRGRNEVTSKVVPILDPSNPLELTRCEFRVCTLVKEGMLAKTIADQLRIRNSTVRSHLKSIYSKTGTACHVELLHSLTADERFVA